MSEGGPARAPGLFNRVLLPGVAFQAVVVGGGYATGRELAQFFLPAGPWGGLLALGVCMVVWSLVLAVSFEFARATHSFEYRAFFKRLLGRGWVLFEVVYIVLLLLVLAVAGSAAGAILKSGFGLPSWVGTTALMVAVAGLAFRGNAAFERFLTWWVAFLVIVYVAFLILILSAFGDRIADTYAAASVGSGWAKAGIAYAGYNLAVAPAVLATARHMRSRRDAVTAGLLAGPLAIAPGVLFFVAMMAGYPSIGAAEVPSDRLLAALNLPLFRLMFQLVLFGTLVDTGAGMIHAINERVAAAWPDRRGPAPTWIRLVVAAVLLVTAIVVANRIGLISLIANGYGVLTWAFITVYVVPILTIGVWRLRTGRAPAESA
ncbi:MAG TPA: hypothetical protein VF559_09955 [Caulobacteraceae bacterium]|jgi:uncharacterized membrane protein YkvI